MFFDLADATDVPKDVVVTRSPDGFSMNIRWTPITLAKARGFPLYVITYKPLSSLKRAAMQASTNMSYVNISGLDPSQSYSVVLSVQTSGGSVFSNASVTYSPIVAGPSSIVYGQHSFAPLLGLALFLHLPPPTAVIGAVVAGVAVFTVMMIVIVVYCIVQ